MYLFREIIVLLNNVCGGHGVIDREDVYPCNKYVDTDFTAIQAIEMGSSSYDQPLLNWRNRDFI